MTDETKVVIDTLYKEFLRISAKSVATDDWFFRFLSIAVVPFLVFLAYCLANPGYRLFVAMLPYLSLIGVAVVAVLSTHYQYVGAYGNYLTRRINGLFGAGKVRDVEFGRACYKDWRSPVMVCYIIGLGALLFLNVLAVPVINAEIAEFLTAGRGRQQLGWAEGILERYWLITACTVTGGIVALLFSAVGVHARTRRLLKSLGHDTVTHPSGDAEEASARP